VAKVAGDATGTLAWARQIGGTGDQLPLALTVDGAGHVFVVGQYGGVLNFGDGVLPAPLASARHMFVANLDSAAGTANKSIPLGDHGAHFAQAVAVDGAGDVLVGGIITATVTFDAAAGIQLSSAGQDGFVTKFSGDLQHAKWARRIGDVISGVGDAGVAQSTDQQRVNGLAVDGSGNVFVAGGFRGVTDFGLGTRTAQGWDAFALSLDKEGNPRWLRTTGGASDESATAVGYSTVSDSVWVAGSFTASVMSKPYANWGMDPMNDLVFSTDDGSTPHTFLVQLMP
jgi:hypothetical protein